MILLKHVVLFVGFLTSFEFVLGAVKTSKLYPDCDDCGICQERYRPICGTDGVTYFNPCHLGCRKQCRMPALRPAYEGECFTPQNGV